MGEGDRCTLCLVGLVTADQAVVGLGCGHSFHTECLVPWLEADGTCPNCRVMALESEGFEGVEGLLGLRTDRWGSSWSSDSGWSNDSSWSGGDDEDESDYEGYRWSWSDSTEEAGSEWESDVDLFQWLP